MRGDVVGLALGITGGLVLVLLLLCSGTLTPANVLGLVVGCGLVAEGWRRWFR